MSRVMAIDYGTRRIGIALSDPLRMIAQGYTTINWNGKDISYAVDQIVRIINEKTVEEILVGRPTKTSGQVGTVEKDAERLADILFEKTQIKPVFLDERYTTVIATRHMNEMNITGKDRKKAVDALAAQVILREYLDKDRSYS